MIIKVGSLIIVGKVVIIILLNCDIVLVLLVVNFGFLWWVEKGSV